MSRRKADGVYYTPAPIVRYIVKHTLGPLFAESRSGRREPLRVLDPACGDGAFLVEAYRRLLRWRCRQVTNDCRVFERRGSTPALSIPSPATLDERLQIIRTHLYGVDIDPTAVIAAKRKLACMALELDEDSPWSVGKAESVERVAGSLDANIRCGDALVGPEFFLNGSREAAEKRGQTPSLLCFNDGGSPRCRGSDPFFQQPFRGDGDPTAGGLTAPFAWSRDFVNILDGQNPGFDAVIGNPPYINIRLLTQFHGEAIKRYFRGRYRCAYRGYDVFVLFLEKAFELLRTGGVCGMIVPNKIAALDYALPCRALLLEHTTLRHIADVSDLKLFPDAGVYPYIVIWQKELATQEHQIAVLHARSQNDLSRRTHRLRIRQSDLSAEAGFNLCGTLDVESRVATQPLAQRATLHSGTTGFAARRLADQLKERKDAAGEACFEFIVSGNIDRYSIRGGDVRYMKRTYRRPVLPMMSEQLTERKRRLFGGCKIVIAGLTRRLEAAWDEGGLALGVQVYAAAEPQDDPRYLLGLLNSKLLSFLFRSRFQAKRLAGGYLAINKGQLAKLPIRAIGPDNREDARRCRRIVQSVDRMIELHGPNASSIDPRRRARLQREIDKADGEIDRLVYELYALTDAEIARVEASFEESSRDGP